MVCLIPWEQGILWLNYRSVVPQGFIYVVLLIGYIDRGGRDLNDLF